MSKVRKLIFIFTICFMCILIPNMSSAAWKEERKFELPASKCNHTKNPKHSTNCIKYATVTKEGTAKNIHIGPSGYSKGSYKSELDKTRGNLCLQHNKGSDDEFADAHLAIQYKMSIDLNKVTVAAVSKEAKEEIKKNKGEEVSTLDNSKYSARFAYILSHINTEVGAGIRLKNGTQGAIWDFCCIRCL